MKRPAFPQDEAERVAALRDLLILDTDPEERFDALTAYCASRFGVKTALLSLVDTERQWFKSAFGLEIRETPREVSFCSHAILEQEPLVVADALADERFHDNPLVTGPPGIRFYAGAPLRVSGGFPVGTLCLVSNEPRRLAEEDLAHLKDLASAISLELEQRAELLARDRGAS